MTRINTNVSSLIAQTNLARVNNDLQISLTRLSTGLRINTGKDDPAGLIASEALRSNIIATEKAITNSERANQLIATADSALGQVSQLLNDIRGLVSEAANTGALSDEQIAANQLQVDSSLEAIDRIAQITSFQGKKLLDGSLDFNTTGVNNSKITSLQIDQANFGTQNSIGVEINVVRQATKGTLNFAFGAIATDLVLQVSGANGAEAFNFAANSTIEEIASAINLVSGATGVEAVVEQASTPGQITLSSYGDNNDVVLTADEAGFDPGNVRVKYTVGTAANTTAAFTAASGSDPAKLDVTLGVSQYAAATAAVDQAGDEDAFTITANINGADFNGVSVNLVDTGAAAAAGDEVVTFDAGTGILTIDVDATSTYADVVAAINNGGTADNALAAALFTAALSGNGNAGGDTVVTANGVATFANGADGGAVSATANDVISAINSAVGNNLVTASLAAGNDGYGVVTEFDNYAYYGSVTANNRLQFLAPDNSPNVRFVSNAGQALSIDTATDPRVESKSNFTVSSTDANASFIVRARYKGTDYDGYTIDFANDVNTGGGETEYVVLDKENKTLTFHIDDGVNTADELVDAINNDSYVSLYFEAEHFGTSDGSGVITTANTNVDGTNSVTSGGLTSAGTLIVNLGTNADGVVQTTAQDLIDFFDDPANAAQLQGLGISVTNVDGSDGSGLLAATAVDLVFATSGTELEDQAATGTTYAVNGDTAQVVLTAINGGAAYDGVRLVFEDDAAISGGGDEVVSYDSINKILKVLINAGTTTAADVVAAIDGDATVGALFDADVVNVGGGLVTVDDYAVLDGGVVDNGSTDGAALLGNSDLANLGLSFQATNYGSVGFVEVKALSGSFNLTNSAGATADRSAGTDVVARINGIQAAGRGLEASVNTSSLDLTFSIAESVADGEVLSFTITGGGALFQLGPQVVSNQQARIGIQSVNSAQLGGVNGQLFELRSGGAKSLTNDVGGAARVADEVISKITGLRGRLGAFQKTTLDTNIFTLNDTLANLREAESSIRDADFAVESSRLTRAQILVQSTTAVLSIAKNNPQNVLALLRS